MASTIATGSEMVLYKAPTTEIIPYKAPSTELAKTAAAAEAHPIQSLLGMLGDLMTMGGTIKVDPSKLGAAIPSPSQGYQAATGSSAGYAASGASGASIWDSFGAGGFMLPALLAGGQAPALAAAIEKAFNAKIVGADGNTLQLQPNPAPVAEKGSLFGGALGAIGGILGGLALAGTGVPGASPFMGVLGLGLENVMKGLGQPGVGSFFAPLFGNPLTRPGQINGNGTLEEIGHQLQTNSIMSDPSLTVEDKVMLVLMLIMKKMDKDILKQTEHINQIQQQQNGRQKKGSAMGLLGTAAGFAAGGPAGAKLGSSVASKVSGATNNSSESIDVETQKLQRMVTKRSNMFDMLKGIMEKYDATAKGVIQSLGR